MRYVARRIFNGITFYGYAYGNDPRPFWSMQMYPETWHVPMQLLELQR